MERRKRCHDGNNVDYGGDELFSIMEVEKRGEYVENEFELKQIDYKQKYYPIEIRIVTFMRRFFENTGED